MVLLGSFRQALVSHRVVTRGDMIQGCLSCSISWGQPCPLPKDEDKCTARSLPSSCMSPPSLLTKTKLNGTSTQFTELPAVTAGEQHTFLCLYLSATGIEDPDAQAKPTAVIASSPAASSWSPRDGEPELSRAGRVGSLGLLRPPRVIHFLSSGADYLVITLCCQKVSDEVRLWESQGWRDTAERGEEGKTAQRLLTDHVPSIKINERLFSVHFWRHRRKALGFF